MPKTDQQDRKTSVPPKERSAAIKWTGVQHTVSLIGWFIYVMYEHVRWEVTLGGVLLILGILNAPALAGKGPAGILSVAGVGVLAAKAIGMKAPFLAALLLVGCGWLTGAGAPVVASAFEQISDLVEREIGRDADDLPSSCEVEHDATARKVLTLCTFCYDLKPGEVCR